MSATLTPTIHTEMCTVVTAGEAAARTGLCARVEALAALDAKVNLGDYTTAVTPDGYRHPTVLVISSGD